jgi:hypothetical protein
MLENTDVTEKLNQVAEKIGLKKHIVGPDQEISTPIDLEAHLGKDGKVYVLDSARFFPLRNRLSW